MVSGRKLKSVSKRREWLTLLNAAEKVSKIRLRNDHYINSAKVITFDKVIFMEWRE